MLQQVITDTHTNTMFLSIELLTLRRALLISNQTLMTTVCSVFVISQLSSSSAATY